jgi:putative RNA 2'-phosphotransferase
MEERLKKLSRTMAYALRHHPESFGLTLDDQGWMPVDELLAALRQRSPWQRASVDDVAAVIAQSDKPRYEMRGGLIRAFYGHSIPQKMTRELATPPAMLFHGTTPEAARTIKVEGLKPMRRQYVHLSAEEATARVVALRRTIRPVILRVTALQAHQQGIKFYYGNDMIWLADPIPPRFIPFVPEEG